MFNKKIESKLWLYVIITMVAIATIWAIVFYPQSLKQTRRAGSDNFSEFKNQLNQAFSLFKKAPNRDKTSNQDEIDSLRASVFGDSIKRPE